MLSPADCVAACVVPLIALVLPGLAAAGEPAGYITIARDVPVHDAFRPGDPGRPTNIATAREDVVMAATTAFGSVPQSLPESSLRDIGAQVAGAANAPHPGSMVSAGAASSVPVPSAQTIMQAPMPETGRSLSGAMSSIGPAVAAGLGAALGGIK